jgi:hypothetical protein
MPRLCFVILAFAALLSPRLSQTERVPDLSPEPKVVLENDFVRVSQVLIGTAKKSSFTVPQGLGVVVVRLIFKTASGVALVNVNVFEVQRVMFLTGGETPGDVKLTFPNGMLEIRLELKSLPPASAFDRDAVKLDPSHNKVLFENDRVRVVDVHFGLGEKGPVVDKRPRVIILLNDMHADVARHEGDAPSPRDGKAGVIQWSLGGSQATMNRNETKLDNIVVEIKGK